MSTFLYLCSVKVLTGYYKLKISMKTVKII